MDWSNEYKLCVIDHYRQNVILWDTWVDYRKLNKDVLILLVEEYNSTADIIEGTMKDIHTSFYCECYIGNKLSGLS
jgi:hypothetical protein